MGICLFLLRGIIFAQNRIDWQLLSAVNACDAFNSFWKPESALAQELHICITEGTLMMFQEILNMNKDIAIAVTEYKEDITLNALNDEI